jgi:cell division protein FtsZ
MLFIAAGMGGGTGTGASSIIAEEAQKMEILTIGIVTIPFAFEGMPKIRKATKGIAELAAHVDAILVINNEKLKQIYPDFDFINAFSKSDDVVCNAAKSIAEIITVSGYINTDFADVYNTLKDGNVAIMNVGVANGENRITNAIYNALQSPIVNTNDVKGAKRILLQFYCSTAHAIKMQEIDQINEFVKQVGEDVEVQWGASLDETLEDSVRVTIIATGYEINDIIELRDGADTDKFIENSYKDKEAKEETKEEAKEETPNTVDDDNSELTFSEDEDETNTPTPTNEATRFTSSNDANTIEINFDDEEPESNESNARKHFFGDWMRGKR